MEVPPGKDVIFPLEIDTTKCEEFFGIRCPYNIHVTGKKTAHRDRFDPRYHWKEHLDYDVGIPHELVSIGIPAIAFALAGALMDSKGIRGALLGGMLGLVIGICIEAST